MPYNINTTTNASSILGVAQASTDILGGYYFGWFISFIVFLVIFMSLKSKGYYTSACFAVACWVNVFLAFLLRAMSLLDNKSFWSLIIIGCISVFILFLSGATD